MEWISVDEKLPEFGDRVLCYTKNGDYITCFLNGRNVWKTLGMKRNYYLSQENWPTHYMSLPQPPVNEIK